MSTFRNMSNGVLYITGYLRRGDGTIGVGAEKYVEVGETFTGSNYYKRFTYAGMIADGIDATRAASEAFLEVVTDDGISFSDVNSAPNNPKVYHETILPGESVVLDFETDLGGPAEFTTIESDEDIFAYLNGSATARVNITAGSTVTFSAGELLLNSLTLSNAVSGAGAAIVQVIVASTV